MEGNGRQVVEALLDQQRQLVTPAQAKAAGAHSSVLPRMERSGALELVLPCVYGTAGAPGIPCTPPRRLAVDIGAVLGETACTTVVRDLRRDHGVTWKQLAAVLELHSKRGRDGCGPLRRQVERYFGIEGIPDSALEQLFLDDIIDADLPVPVCQHPVPGPNGVVYRLDFAYPDDMLDVEIDGPHHRRPEVAARDRRRDAYLRAHGWEVLRFDEAQVTYSPLAALGAVRRSLRLAPTWR